MATLKYLRMYYVQLAYMTLNLIVVVNYVHDVKWIRISTNHIQFNCTLACRSPITHCVVELNTTKNISSEMNKEDFSSWAIVDFFLLDTHRPFTYTVFAQGRSENVLGQRVNGSIPLVSTVYRMMMPFAYYYINIAFNRCTKYQ